MLDPQFDAVDSTDPAAAAAFLELALSMPEVVRWKQFSYDLLEIDDGDQVIDIGCGTGADVVQLAKRVGLTGRVVGVDFSEYLLRIAAARVASADLPIVLRQADAYDLPFSDGSFSRTRIDRVLHFLRDPIRALREAIRVTERGGLIVATEPDWSSLSVSGGEPDLTTRVLSGAVAINSNARIGSILSKLFLDCGLQAVESHIAKLELNDYRAAAILFGLRGLVARAIAAGRINGNEAVRWLRSLQEASDRDTLSCTLSGAISRGSVR